MTKRFFTELVTYRSSRPEVLCKKGVLRNFAKFTEKHLRPATLLKKRLWHRCFPVNFVKFLRTPFFAEHIWWLLPNILSFVREKELLEQMRPQVRSVTSVCKTN